MQKKIIVLVLTLMLGALVLPACATKNEVQKAEPVPASTVDQSIAAGTTEEPAAMLESSTAANIKKTEKKSETIWTDSSNPAKDCAHESKQYSITQEANCTAEGKGEYVCNSCGVIVSTLAIPAKGHHEKADPAVEATCQKTGLTAGSHCDRCGEVLKEQTVIPLIEHRYEDGVCIWCGQNDPAYTPKEEYISSVIENELGSGQKF